MPWFRRLPRPRLASIAIAAAAIIPLALFAIDTVHDYQDEADVARQFVAGRLELLRAHADKLLEVNEGLVAGVAQHFGRFDAAAIEAAPERHEVFLAGVPREPAQVVGVAVIDSQGKVVAGSFAADASVGALRASTRDFFARARRSAESDLIVSEPLPGLVKGSDESTIALARRRSRADGAFDGVCVVVVRLTSLLDFWTSLPTPFPGAELNSLVAADGKLLLRRPGGPVRPGEELPPTTIVRQAIDRGETQWTGWSTSPIDNAERMFGTRRLSRYPLYVNYGVRRDAVIAQFYRHVTLYGAIVAAAMVALVGLAAAVRRQSRALERSNARLHEAIRNQEIAEQALREADRRKDQFIAMLAHELRNPLAPIANAIAVVDHGVGDPGAMAQLKRIATRQLRNITRLIDDLLDVSRVASGKIVLNRQAIDIADVVRESTELCRALLEEKGQRLVVLTQEGAIVDGDRMRLSQVFVNLVTNAGKYTQHGGTVQVALTIRDRKIVVAVRDNGIGLERSHLSRLFEPFWQVEQVPGRGPGGLGLGLALVKSIVELHQGSVVARSPGLGRGSEFEVTLPRCAPPVTQPPSVPDPRPTRSEPTSTSTS